MQYSKLVDVYEQLNSTSKRLQKTLVICDFLKEIEVDDMEHVMLLLEGRIFPSYESSDIGVASRLMLKSLAIAIGTSTEKIEAEWKKLGDLGLVAQNLSKTKRQATLKSTKLTTKKVFENLRKLTELGGQGAVDRKTQLISELITSANPSEAKYIVKTILGEMRIGLGEGTMRDAIAWAFFSDQIGIDRETDGGAIDIKNREAYKIYIDAIQSAYDATNEFALVARAAKAKGLEGLKHIEIRVGVPIKVMLSLKADSIEDAFEAVGNPMAAEFKYDGFRIQAHKDTKGNIRLFTRRLEDVTTQFPDIVSSIRRNIGEKSFIIDGEAVGYDNKTKRYLPFQSISQRIKRKYEIQKMANDFPVELNIFDIMHLNGKNLINENFGNRREILEKIVYQEPLSIVLSKFKVLSQKSDVEKLFEESVGAGNEGLMLKSLGAPYKPGARVGYMLKLKSMMENLDLVVVGAEWGEGKRSKWLSSYTIACLDSNEARFLEVGKVSTGLKEKNEEGLSFDKMTRMLNPLIIGEKGKEVTIKPKIVLEVGYEEIQKSPTYASGFALRFPRVIGSRDDKSAQDASTLDYVTKLYYLQKKNSK